MSSFVNCYYLYCRSWANARAAKRGRVTSSAVSHGCQFLSVAGRLGRSWQLAVDGWQLSWKFEVTAI
jgi:hypothetical protein